MTSVNTPFFDWSDVEDPSLVRYQLQVDNNPDFSSPEIDVSDLILPTYYIPTTILPDGVYSWRVRAIDGVGHQGSWSAVWLIIISPDITVLPTLLDFAYVEVGSIGDLSLTLRNDGTTELMVTGISVPGTPFSLVSPPSTPFILLSGEIRDVTVRFNPTASGSFSASLTISSNDPDEGVVSVNLRGTGKKNISSKITSLSVTPTQGEVPLGVTFNATASDEDGVIVEYRWYFGDGTTGITTVNTTNHPYTAAGTITAKVTVIDGGIPQTPQIPSSSASDSAEIKVFERSLSGKIRFTKVDSKDAGTEINIWIEAFSPSVDFLRKALVTIPNVQPGGEANYSLLLNPGSDYKVKPWLKDPYFVPEKSIDLSQGDKIEDLAVKISREITGTVIDKDTGNPLAEAIIEVYEIDGPGGNIVAFAGDKKTGADGTYSIRVENVGWYRVIARPLGFPKAKSDKLLTRLSVVVDFAISKGISFQGVVKDSEGKPIANATMSAFFKDATLEELVNTSTNGQEEYTLAGLKSDKIYTITASAAGFVKKTHTVAINEFSQIDPSNSKTDDNIDRPQDFILNVSAIDNEGERETSNIGPFVVDTNPPAEVVGFTATPQIGSIQVMLSWLTPGDGDYRGTRILFRRDSFPERIDDGTGVTDDITTPRASQASFTHTGLEFNTSYFYTSFAYDSAGNFSGGVRTRVITPLEPSTTTTTIGDGFPIETPSITISSEKIPAPKGTGFNISLNSSQRYLKF